MDQCCQAEQKERRYFFYVCPFCNTETGRMTPIGNGYRPTEVDLANRPDMEHIGTEQMRCPCGVTLTWFDVEEIEYVGPGILIPTKRP